MAGFLLGRRLEVTTRHWTRAYEEAIKFGCEIESKNLKLEYASRKVGTSVEVELTEEVYKQLTTVERYSRLQRYENWDWYAGRRPMVRRFVNGEEVNQKFEVEGGGTLWHSITPDGFDEVRWSYGKSGRVAETLFCNNIFVTSRYYQGGQSLDISPQSPAILIKDPAVAVFDSFAKLPLTLQRNALATNSLPFEAELLDDLGIHFAKEVERVRAEIIGEPGKQCGKLLKPGITGFNSSEYRFADISLFFIANDQFIPADRRLFYLRRPSVLVVLAVTEISQDVLSLQNSIEGDELLLIVKVGSEKGPRSSWLRSYFLCDRIGWFLSRCELLYSLLISKAKMVDGVVQSQYVPPSFYNKSEDLKKNSRYDSDFSGIEVARFKTLSYSKVERESPIVARSEMLATRGVKAVSDIGINWEGTNPDFFEETPLARGWGIISAEGSS